MIRVAVTDNYAQVRRGLKLLIDSFDDLLFVGDASNGSEALELCAVHQPDVLLLDPAVPDYGATHIVQEICQRFPHITIILLSSHASPQAVAQLLAAGANVHLQKNGTPEAIIEVIRQQIRQ